MRQRLTDRIAKTLGPGLYWDTHEDAPNGFLLQVTPGGARTFRLNYRRADGVERRMTVGSVQEYPRIADARKKAAELRLAVRDGRDPLGEAEDRRAEPTVAALAERFIEEALPRRQPRTRAEYKAMIDAYILPAIGRMKVSAVVRDDLQRLHDRISSDGKLRRANAVLTVAHVLFEQAIDWKVRDEHTNPAGRIARNREHHRERYLSTEEVERLNAALERWEAKEPDSVDMVRLLLLTGARRGEVVGMRWSDVDLDNAVWTKPAESVKQRRQHRLPISPEAVELLRRRRAEQERGPVVSLKDDRVFRGRGAVAFRLERHWVQIRAAAELEDVRLHDLRHSHASLLIAQGLSLPIIGALLGHSGPAITARYAHLADQPLREAAAIVGRIVGGGKGTAK